MNQRLPPPRLALTDYMVMSLLLLGTLAAVWLTESDIGFTRDEGYYFKAARLYFPWFSGLFDFDFSMFSATEIKEHWKYNHEHPVVLKSLFALSWGILHERLGWFDSASTAFRFPSFVMSGVCVAMIYGLGRTLGLRRFFAVGAALFFLAMPRVFWHMHLACFDIGVCAAHVGLVWAYMRYRHTIRGSVFIGIAFGCAAAIKHNVLPVPALFVLHWFMTESDNFIRRRKGLLVPPLPLSFFAMAILGPIVFVLLWPYLWHETLPRLGWYLGFHLQHEHYPILWFRELLTKPPFPISFPFVMSALTIPFPMFVAFIGATLASIWYLLRHRTSGSATRNVRAWSPESSGLLMLLIQGLFPFVLIALPGSPIFGGTKHWMNGLPFFCVLAGWAFQKSLSGASSSGQTRTKAVVSFCVGLSIASGVFGIVRSHPHGLSSYSLLAGFERGAANLGMQRTFWGYEIREALPFVRANLPKGAHMMFGDTNRDDVRAYRDDGLLPPDVRTVTKASKADIASVEPQGEFKGEWLKVLNSMPGHAPDLVIDTRGVPLLTVTVRERDGS